MAVTSYYVQLPFQPSPTSTLLSRQSTLTFLVHFILSGDRMDMFISLFSVEDCFFGVGLMVMTFFSLCLSWRTYFAYSITKDGLLDTVISGTFFRGLEAVLCLPAIEIFVGRPTVILKSMPSSMT